MMLKMEISQVYINNSSVETKSKLTDDVCRLLQVREKNEAMQKDWLLFISTSNLKVTAGEIYLAFKMALSREILDSNGKEIDLFPELSNNTTGKVISAYLKYKKDNHQYQLAKDKLKALKSPVNDILDSDKKKLRENLLKMIFDEITETGFSSDAWHLYSELEISGKISPSKQEKSKLYKEQLKIYEIEEKAIIRKRYDSVVSKMHLASLVNKITSKTPVESVSNKCRSIIVSNYLKAFTEDFEKFKNAL